MLLFRRNSSRSLATWPRVKSEDSSAISLWCTSIYLYLGKNIYVCVHVSVLCVLRILSFLYVHVSGSPAPTSLIASWDLRVLQPCLNATFNLQAPGHARTAPCWQQEEFQTAHLRESLRRRAVQLNLVVSSPSTMSRLQVCWNLNKFTGYFQTGGSRHLSFVRSRDYQFQHGTRSIKCRNQI